jgi:hypothetical protein
MPDAGYCIQNPECGNTMVRVNGGRSGAATVVRRCKDCQRAGAPAVVGLAIRPWRNGVRPITASVLYDEEKSMGIRPTAIGVGLVACALATAASAQNTADVVQRDVNQQNRIEQGLKSGDLTTKEAGKLEREESKVDKMQSNALKDGNMTAAEKQRIERAQNKVSKDIYQEKHDAKTGNPDSASSQRMQADVQRNANQEQRIENGVKGGSLTNREAANLERGQARVDRKEANAAANGHVGAGGQKNIQAAENRQSRRIHREKHNARKRD